MVPGRPPGRWQRVRKSGQELDSIDEDSAAYLTVSETWPIEIRAEAIAVFFAIGSISGAIGPVFYGALIGNGSSKTGLFVGYLIGAAIMLAGGLVEVFLGVNAAGKSLEQVTKPLTSTDQRVPAATVSPHREPGLMITGFLRAYTTTEADLAHPWPAARCAAVTASRRGAVARARSRVLRQDYPFWGDASLPRTRDARGMQNGSCGPALVQRAGR
jgi:hypothetical protein